MRKIAFVMSIVAAVLLAVACQKGGSKGDRDKDKDEDVEETVDFSFDDVKDMVSSALEDCGDWTADDCLQFHKERTQMSIDFYESDPTVEDWLQFRKMMDSYRVKMLRKTGAADMGPDAWPCEQDAQFEPDDEAQKLDAKLKKVYTKWKKAHADELSEVIANPLEDQPAEEVPVEDEDATDGLDGQQGNSSSDDDTVFPAAEVQPAFPGDFGEWASQHLEYPAEAMTSGKEGRVICQFIVEKDGSVSGATVLRSDDPVFNDAALRLINSMPKWTPGQVDGKNVRVSFTLPISFKLGD